MGLHMYVYRREHGIKKQGAGHWDTSNSSVVVWVIDEDKPDTISNNVVETEVCYWRKANAIHHWIISNCANGVDSNSEYIPFPIEKIRELYDLAIKVAFSLRDGNTTYAEEMLPTASGFFFGDVSYGDAYIEALNYTIKCFGDILNNSIRYPNDTYSYYANW